MIAPLGTYFLDRDQPDLSAEDSKSVQAAVLDYCTRMGIKLPMHDLDLNAVWWPKESCEKGRVEKSGFLGDSPYTFA